MVPTVGEEGPVVWWWWRGGELSTEGRCRSGRGGGLAVPGEDRLGILPSQAE